MIHIRERQRERNHRHHSLRFFLGKQQLEQQLFCMLSVIERGLEPVLWSGTDWWSLLLGVWKRPVCPAVLVACRVSVAFLNGLCSSLTEKLQWHAVAKMNQSVFSTSCVITSLQRQVSRTSRKIFSLSGHWRAIVLLNRPITFDIQSWWCFTFIDLICCEQSDKWKGVFKL